jgi:hypothetical protein
LRGLRFRVGKEQRFSVVGDRRVGAVRQPCGLVIGRERIG